MKRMSKFARRCAALMLAVVLLCMAVPAAFAAEGDALPAGATTMGGANTTLIPDEGGKLPELALRLRRYHHHALPERQGAGPAPERDPGS